MGLASVTWRVDGFFKDWNWFGFQASSSPGIPLSFHYFCLSQTTLLIDTCAQKSILHFLPFVNTPLFQTSKYIYLFYIESKPWHASLFLVKLYYFATGKFLSIKYIDALSQSLSLFFQRTSRSQTQPPGLNSSQCSCIHFSRLFFGRSFDSSNSQKCLSPGLQQNQNNFFSRMVYWIE